jgi:small subunit ribosomal protein S2
MVDYKVPGNDDAIRAIRLFCAIIADAVVEGKAIFERVTEEEGKDGVSGSPEPSAGTESAQPQVTEGN